MTTFSPHAQQMLDAAQAGLTAEVLKHARDCGKQELSHAFRLAITHGHYETAISLVDRFGVMSEDVRRFAFIGCVQACQDQPFGVVHRLLGMVGIDGPYEQCAKDGLLCALKHKNIYVAAELYSLICDRSKTYVCSLFERAANAGDMDGVWNVKTLINDVKMDVYLLMSVGKCSAIPHTDDVLGQLLDRCSAESVEQLQHNNSTKLFHNDLLNSFCQRLAAVQQGRALLDATQVDVSLRQHAPKSKM